MNISGYFVLVGAVILINFAQQSDAGFVSVLDSFKDVLNIGNKYERDTIKYITNAAKEYNVTSVYIKTITIDIRESYINGTKQLAKSEEIILDAIQSVKNLILENPEAAKKILLKAFEDAQNVLFKSGIPVLKVIGKVLGLTNEGASQGLMAASEFIQKVGISSLDALNIAKNLFIRGIAAGDNSAEELLKAVRLTIESGYAAGFKYLQGSVENAYQALRDAQSRPVLGKVQNQNCEAAAGKDPQVLSAIKDINEAAKIAIKRGANLYLVQKLTQTLICALSEARHITAEAQKTVENLNTIAKVEPLVAKITFFKQFEVVKKGIYEVVSKIVLVLGDVALKSGSLSDSEVEAAIIALEQGLIEMFLGIETAGDLIVNGLRYGGDASTIAIEAAGKTVSFAERAFIQGILKVGKLVSKVL